MKEEIFEFLRHERKNLPPKKRQLYTLLYVLMFLANACLIVYLGSHLSYKMFIIFGVIYCSALLYLDSAAKKRKEE